MKKFVEVFIGSRGYLEEVKVVKTDLTLNEYYSKLVEGILEDLKENSEDGEDLGFMTEFVGIEDYKGFSVVGLNEEESLIVLDFEVNKELCKKLSKLWEDEDFDSILDIIGNLEY